MSSFYDLLLAQSAGPPLAPETPTERLALDKHRPPPLPLHQSRHQLESREKSLLRELQAIEKELASVRKQLAS